MVERKELEATPEEIAARMERALKRSLTMPPQPHAKPKKRKPKKKQEPRS